MTRDLTSGRPMRLIIEFAIPTMLGLLFQQFYAMVDSMIVGKLLGAGALASVGATTSINFMVIGFCLGICTGFAISVAQAFGAADYGKMRRLALHCGYLSVIFAVVLTLITCLGCRHILHFMDTPDDIFTGAYYYIFIIFLGIPATFLYNMPAELVRAMGDSRTPVYFLALASLLNIVLDLVFILCFDFGVAGAAIATVIAQGISGCASLCYMLHKFPVLHTKKGEWGFDGRMAVDICAIGLPMGLQYSITAIGGIILQSMVNGLGSLYVAAAAAGHRVLFFFVIPFDALGATMATYCGQNVGAKKLDRLGQGIGASAILGFFYSIGLLLFLWFAAPHLLLLLLNQEEQSIIQSSTQYIRIALFFMFPLSLVNIVRFSIQGMGFSNLAMIAGLLEMVARTVCGLFIPTFGFIAAILAGPVAWIMATAFLVPAAMLSIRYLKKQQTILE